MKTVKLIYDNSSYNPDLYYVSGFKAHDPIIYFEYNKKRYLVLNDLEIDRGKKQSKVNHILSLTEYKEKAEKNKKDVGIADVLHEIFKEKKIKKIIVPSKSYFFLIDNLRKYNYKIEKQDMPFYEERFIKTEKEKRYITEVQKHVFLAMGLAQDVLKKSKIKNNRIFYRGKILTSEGLRKIIEVFLFEKGFTASESIVACGNDSIDPHSIGTGPLKPHQSIVVDVFPKSQTTWYYGDATRTFCKGSASDALKKMYAIVKKAQEMGIKKIKPGINGKSVHQEIDQLFIKNGYKTGLINGRNQGFFHNTGHSIGLELHEEPGRIGPRDFKLKKGHIMSVEPGLYYKEIGGVRIEDLVYIDSKGAKILGSFPKKLEV